MNSRDKGARGERDWRDFLRSIGCTNARRGCQHAGGPDSPDVADGIPDTHAEVKRTERLQLHAAMAQAIGDAGDALPYVAHRRNGDEWLVTLRAKDLMRLAECLAAIEGKPIYPKDDQ